MAQLVPYLLGGLTAFLVTDIVPVPSPTEQFGAALRAGISAPAAALGTPASSIHRAAKSDRGAAPRPASRNAAIVYRDRELFRTDLVSNVTIVTKGLQLPEVTVRQHSSSAVKPIPVDALQEQARDRKPPEPRQRKLPIGCEPMFSPVASPSLAHHAGRCMAHLTVPWSARFG